MEDELYGPVRQIGEYKLRGGARKEGPVWVPLFVIENVITGQRQYAEWATSTCTTAEMAIQLGMRRAIAVVDGGSPEGLKV
jgi:hypothetical protein